MSRYQNHPTDPSLLIETATGQTVPKTHQEFIPMTQEEQDSFCGWCGSVTCSMDPPIPELQLQVADMTQTIEMLSAQIGILNARIAELEN